MRAFIDTSTLLKKYYDEEGSDEFLDMLDKVSEIVIAPIYVIEAFSMIERIFSQNIITRSYADWLEKEVRKDLYYFSKINWSEPLEDNTLGITKKYRLKPLDSIQLASGIIAQPDIFITSDNKLYNAARQELKNVRLV